MLRAAHQALKPGGRLAASTVALASGLTGDALEHALEIGPPHVTAPEGYPSLCAQAGFTDIAVTDLTGDYEDTARRWMEEWDRESGELAELLGDDFHERQRRRRNALPAIGGGLLKRYLVLARKP